MATTVAPAARAASPEALPVELARALGDPLRWRIVELLSTEQLCVAHLSEELQAAQPLVSHHLKVLREAGAGGGYLGQPPKLGITKAGPAGAA